MKLLYVRPKIVVFMLFLEQSCAVGSANIIIGGPNESIQPEVDDWTNEGLTGADWNL